MRHAAQLSSPIPTFSDLRDELAQWRDEEKIERATDEARLASMKLRQWTGEKGIYSKLFDLPTTMRLDNNWLFFNLEQLSSDPRLGTAMSMVIANAVSERAAGKTGQPSITVLDECWFLLDSTALTIALGDSGGFVFRSRGDGRYDDRFRRPKEDPKLTEMLLELGAKPYTGPIRDRSGE